jgi:formylglycine-generating enzyme required for sulfatase activity
VTGNNPSTVSPEDIPSKIEESVTGVHPVENVNYYDFDDWMNRICLRLPSEAEWEYAARGGTKSIRWTNGDGVLFKKAVNLADLTCSKAGIMPKELVTDTDFNDGYVGHAPVFMFEPNQFGLHNVYGNVWEWCADDWHDDYMDAPLDGSAWRTGGKHGVNRGGGWNSKAYRCTSVYRRQFPKVNEAWALGVRPARSLDENREQ